MGSTNASVLEIISGNKLKVFLKYAIPNIITLMAMSSSAIVDAMFVGHYVGDVQLASINIIAPIVTLISGVSIMLTVGGAVHVGKFLGEGTKDKASAMFTKTIIAVAIFSMLLSFICFTFNKEIARLLGANEELLLYSGQYLRIIAIFFLFQASSYTYSMFVRMDGSPFLATAGIVIGMLTNFLLDYMFIYKFQYGVEGAAYATGLANIVSFSVLISHFLFRKTKLRFTRRVGEWKALLSSSYNGLSELLNEASAGIIVFIFNWVMITRLGTSGVAAFTVINYTLWAGCMLSYAIGDALMPLITINYGALNPKRIRIFKRMAIFSVLCVGAMIISLLTLIPEKMIGLFLTDKTSEAYKVSLEFAMYVKFAFLFSGTNIILSAYFTSIHRARESMVIALSRGLLLPLAYMFTLPYIFGDIGVFLALPLSEFTTLIIAIFLTKYTNIETLLQNKKPYATIIH